MSEGAQILLELLRYMNRTGKGIQPVVFLALIDCLEVTQEEQYQIHDIMRNEMAVLDAVKGIINDG